jgi:hypothetical protein
MFRTNLVCGMCFVVVALLTQIVLGQQLTELSGGEGGGGESGGTIEELSEAPQGQEALPAPAGGSARQYRLLVPGGPPQGVEEFGQYSNALQASFVLRWYRLGPHVFPGAKLLSFPDQGSPLRQIGLRPGDIITRLDGLRVSNYAELERHFADTTVRYVRYPGTIRVGTIYIDADLITP